MKQCSACQRELPATAEFFARRGSSLRGQCRECRSAADRAWRTANAERLADYYREYHAENRARRLGQMAANYAGDRDSYRARERRWRAQNPEAEAARRRRRRALIAAADGDFTSQEWASLQETYGGCCLACGADGPLVPDHVVPLSKGGSNSISSIQPLCTACNSAKGTSRTDYR